LARARSEESTKGTSVNENEIPVEIGPEESRHSRSHIFRRPRSRPTLSFVETHGQLVDTSGLQDSVMLMLATNTPLPLTPTMVFDSVDGVVNPHFQHIHDGMNLHVWDIITRS
jgi:hypothetical protein